MPKTSEPVALNKSEVIRVALDAMGGDKAPDIVIKGANLALDKHPSVHFIIYGDLAVIEPMVSKFPRLTRHCSLRHAPNKINPEGSVVQALRQKETSMRLAIEAVKNKEADCVVSAGNTGVLMGLSYLLLRTLPGIDRPAITSFFPTLEGRACMLDLGANIQCSAQNLVEFAVMGCIFARVVLGINSPGYGLLNVGTEPEKGLSYIKDAAQKIDEINQRFTREQGIPGRYLGYVEGDDVHSGKADVIVTDGFTGNVALKTSEGTARLTTEYMRLAFNSSFLAKISYLFVAGSLRKIRHQLDPRRYNGAILLGLNGVTVKSHGGTDDLGFSNAISVGINIVDGKVQEAIQKELEKLSDLFNH